MLDGDGRGDARNFVHIGLFNALEELPSVGGERFDITTLAFGVDRIEGQAGFTRSRYARDHGYGVVRDLKTDVFEVMYARAGNGNERGFVGNCGLVFELIWHRFLHSRNFRGSLNKKLYDAAAGPAMVVRAANTTKMSARKGFGS